MSALNSIAKPRRSITQNSERSYHASDFSQAASMAV
jgi:hypothetical protein